MAYQNKENLKKLSEKFVDAEQAQNFANDVHAGDQIFLDNAAKVPDETRITDIKNNVAATLSHKKVKSSAFRRAALKVAAVAAVVLVIAVINVKLSRKTVDKPTEVVTASIMPKLIWESEDLAADDEDLAILAHEVQQLENELLSIQLDENNGNGYLDLTELEMELIKINSTFWKG